MQENTATVSLPLNTETAPPATAEERYALLEARVKELEQVNAQQARDNEDLNMRLKQHPKEITREVEVAPPDYAAVKAKVRNQERIIKKYEQIMALGGVSDLTLLIDSFIDTAKNSLKKIGMEIQCTNYDKTQIQRIIKLCDFLEKSRDELYSFVSVAEEGKFISHPEFRKVIMDIQTLTGRLNDKSRIYKIPENELPDMHQTLVQVIEALRPYTNRDDY